MHDHTQSSRRGIPQLAAHPGRKQDDTQGRSPGYRLYRDHPPSRINPVAVGRTLAGYSCGGSHGIEPCSLNPAFLLFT